MIEKYDPKEFVNSVTGKFKNETIVCPICGGNEFTTTEDFASIIISNDMNGIQIGNSIPAGMIICRKCGYIHFFALGALGLLPKKEGNKDGDK